MPTPRPLAHPITGATIPFAPMYRVERANFWVGALPGWLQSSGTYAQDSLNSNYGFGRVTTTAVSGNAAYIGTSFTIGLAQPAAIALTVQGMRPSADGTFDYGLSLSDPADLTTAVAGVTLQHRASQATAELVLHSATGDNVIPIHYLMRGVQNITNRRNLTLLYARLENLVLVKDGDSVIHAQDVTGIFTAGIIRPKAFIIARDANARTLQLGAMQLELWN